MTWYIMELIGQGNICKFFTFFCQLSYTFFFSFNIVTFLSNLFIFSRKTIPWTCPQPLSFINRTIGIVTVKVRFNAQLSTIRSGYWYSKWVVIDLSSKKMAPFSAGLNLLACILLLKQHPIMSLSKGMFFFLIIYLMWRNHTFPKMCV